MVDTIYMQYPNALCGNRCHKIVMLHLGLKWHAMKNLWIYLIKLVASLPEVTRVVKYNMLFVLPYDYNMKACSYVKIKPN